MTAVLVNLPAPTKEQLATLVIDQHIKVTEETVKLVALKAQLVALNLFETIPVPGKGKVTIKHGAAGKTTEKFVLDETVLMAQKPSFRDKLILAGIIKLEKKTTEPGSPSVACTVNV